MRQRFGRNRHQPRGEWVRTTGTNSVVGVQYRKSNAEAFAKAVRKAEGKGLIYGVQLEHQPDNPHDPNAIAVYGVADIRGWFRRGVRVWHVGYLDSDLSAELHRDLISLGLSIAAELYSIYVSDKGYIDIKVIILAPPGHSENARNRRSARE